MSPRYAALAAASPPVPPVRGNTSGHFWLGQPVVSAPLLVGPCVATGRPLTVAAGCSQQSGTHRLLLDSNSQSTACRPDFAPEYAVDDSERALLLDIQNNEIASYGKKVVDVSFIGTGEERMAGRLKMDVSDVGKNVASMGRMLQAGLDLHFTNRGHDCWMEKDGQRTSVQEDDATCDAPLYFVELQVLPVPTQRFGESSLDKEPMCLVAPISANAASAETE